MHAAKHCSFVGLTPMTQPTASQPHASPSAHLQFHGGLVGSLLPLLLFLAGVAWLGISGAPDERGLWPLLILSLGIGALLAKDRTRYSQALVDGMARPLVAVMVLAWMLAGILSTLLGKSGVLDALVQVAQAAGVSGGGFVMASFVVGALLSTATGTSLGTLLLTVPLLFPAAGSLGADPVFLLGALLGGATFGDNISPISDTTIASAGTQGADLGTVVRSRLRYALPAAGVALVIYGLFGGASSAVGTTALATEAGGDSRALLMLLAPALVLFLLLRKQALAISLLAGVFAAATLGLALGRFKPTDLLSIDAENFIARGLIADGIEKSVGVVILTLLLMALAGALEDSGLIERLLATAKRRVAGTRQAEGWIFAAISGAVMITTQSGVAILTVGRFTRDLGDRFGIAPARRANILDVTSCTYPFLLPYFIPTILAAGLSASGAERGVERVSALNAGLFNFHSWGLLVMIVMAVATGWGRNAEGVAVDPEASQR